MDFFVVITEWLDLGISSLMFLWLLQLYRHRHILRDSLWWVTAHYRREALVAYLDVAIRQGEVNPSGKLAIMLENMGHPLSAAERKFATDYQNANICHNINQISPQGVETDGTTRAREP